MSKAGPARGRVGHSWAYLPDVAETIAALLDRERDLQAFDSFHVEGVRCVEGRAMAGEIARAIGRPGLPVRRLPWPLIRLVTPFDEILREMLEVRDLWFRPVRLGNAKLTAFLGREPRTPLPDALRATLQSLSCPKGAASGAMPRQAGVPV